MGPLTDYVTAPAAFSARIRSQSRLSSSSTWAQGPASVANRSLHSAGVRVAKTSRRILTA